ncbi:hypothetical protein HY486_00865 [Candidatus Woesearchaeota archaeon]|nr:hypothetical protein [Candidatus Woesearchaeota archaeon]
MEQGTNGPAKKFKAGAIRANVWKNIVENGEYYTVSLDRSYKDKEGNWKNTSTLRANDLPKATLVLGEAFKFVTMQPEDGK